mmetsp:Transcript_13237/g.42238  ORF Transcript_13237/g.42238 Transcript_13237/m.42238 type:complete len:209 (-) Transcript_13237:838-1464(-)
MELLRRPSAASVIRRRFGGPPSPPASGLARRCRASSRCSWAALAKVRTARVSFLTLRSLAMFSSIRRSSLRTQRSSSTWRRWSSSSAAKSTTSRSSTSRSTISSSSANAVRLSSSEPMNDSAPSCSAGGSVRRRASASLRASRCFISSNKSSRASSSARRITPMNRLRIMKADTTTNRRKYSTTKGAGEGDGSVQSVGSLSYPNESQP